MSATALVESLALQGWKFWREGERLRYRAPTEACSQATLAALREIRDEVLHLLDTRPEVFDVCPLSHGQGALWFLWRLAPGSLAYNQCLAVALEETDAEACRAACVALVARHASLRTTFGVMDGQPVQRVHPPREDVDFEVVDGLPAGRGRPLSEVVAVHNRAFDLERGPVVRFRLLWHRPGAAGVSSPHGRSGDAQGAVLLVLVHHIVADGWSLEILKTELRYLCDAHRRGVSLALPALAHTYHGFIRWQASLLAGARGERLVSYWRRQLTEPLPVLDLPADRPRPKLPTYRGGVVGFGLDGATRRAVAELAREEGTSRFVVYLAAFFVLLHRLTGEEDLIVGTPVAGRPSAELSNLVGYFVDPVAIRARLASRDSFRDLLRRVRATVLGALEHQDLPFAYLVEKLQPVRDASRSPIFDVLFQSYAASTAAEPGAESLPAPGAPDDVLSHDVAAAGGKFDLSLTVREEGTGKARGSLGYNADLFDRETAEVYGRSYLGVLHAVAARPDVRCREVPLDGGLDTSWQPLVGADPGPSPADVHEWVKRWARDHPHRVALKTASEELTYEELHQRSTRLAHRLRAVGVGWDTPVGLHLGRSADAIVAILATWKAGGAYVPLDPVLPDKLLGSMARHLGLEVVVSHRSLGAGMFPHAAHVVDPDQDPDPEEGWWDAADLEDQPPPPECLAYGLFTSGSTGRPKAVGVSRRALANYVAGVVDELEVAHGSAFLHVSTLSADLGNTMLFPCLATAGCLHLLADEATTDAEAFARYVSRHAIDYLKIVPSHFEALAAARPLAELLPRKALVLGGEALSSRLVDLLVAAQPSCRVVNHYGPTEATVGVMTSVPETETRVPGSVPWALARPLPGTVLYVLDEDGRKVPARVPGEVYIGGLCLARGYLNDPRATASRFVPNPFAGEDDGGSSVLYRTGDRARYLSDGRLELLGRTDRQVKLRGYRVELAQIEAVLRESPEVEQGVVLVRDGGEASGPGGLLACVVLRGSASGNELEGSAAAVRRFLEERLPEYMVPRSWVVLETMPLTANGKVDLAALRRLPVARSQEARAAPRDVVEHELSQIFSALLGVSRVGLGESFFELGGHSLLAVRLGARIEEVFGNKLSLAKLYGHPTVEGLADQVRSARSAPRQASTAPSDLVPLRREGSETPLFLIPGAGGNVLYYRDLVHHLGPEQPVWAFQAPGLVPGEPIPTGVEEVAKRYVAGLHDLDGRDPARPLRLAGHSYGGLVAFAMARRLLDQGHRVAFLGILDNPAPAPGQRELYAGWDEGRWLTHVGVRIAKLYDVDLGLGHEPPAGRTYDEAAQDLIDRLLRRNLLPAGTRRKDFRRFLDVYRANAMAAAAYEPQELGSGVSLTLFVSSEDDAELDGVVRRGRGRFGQSEDPTLGWAAYTREPVRVVEVPGSHLTMLSEPCVAELARRLGETMRVHAKRSRGRASAVLD